MKWILSFIIFVISSFLFGTPTQETLSSLSINDRMYMRCLAKAFIESDHASHVLFFKNKAVSVGGCILQGKGKRYRDVQYAKGWQLLKKHEHLFPHPNFIFQEFITEDNGLCGYYKILGIYFINKESLEICLTKHLSIFKETLGGDFDITHFIQALENGSPLKVLLHEDEMLLGILLGYGAESSAAFKKVQCKHNGLFPPAWKEDYCGIDMVRPKGCRIYPIVFMGNPHSEEVKNLGEIYDTELAIFWDTYKNKDPLSIFLKGLTEDTCHLIPKN